MKNLVLWAICSLAFLSQTNAQLQTAPLLGNWDDPTIIGSSVYNNRYSGVWGITVNGREYGIIGSTKGTHFIDITNPTAPVQVAFVAGAAQGAQIIHREFKNYGNYVYAVCDEGASTLQIMDCSNLPNSVTKVYDSNAILVRSHNIFVDAPKKKLYCAIAGTTTSFNAMAVLSIENPISPTLIGYYNNLGGVSIGHVHDMYVRSDTAYLNCGPDGFYVANFENETPQLLGSLTSYTERGYNHSGWLSDDGKYYYMADENHGFRMKTLDVSNLNDIQEVGLFNLPGGTVNQIPHNQFIHCGRLYVSYYYDGLVVYDLADPAHPNPIFHYDTYPQVNDNSYEGAWGVYPSLPSGNVLISDMQTGLYIIGGTVKEECVEAISTENQTGKLGVELVSNIVSHQLHLKSTDFEGQVTAQITDISGKILQTTPLYLKNGVTLLPINGNYQGCYFLRIESKTGTYQIFKFFITN